MSDFMEASGIVMDMDSDVEISLSSIRTLRKDLGYKRKHVLA